MKSDKIAIIHPSLGIGGAEKIIAFLANRLCDKYSVDFIKLKDSMDTLKLDDRINVIKLNCYSEKPIIGRNVFSGIKSFLDMRESIYRVIREGRYNLLLCFDLRVLLAVSYGKIMKLVPILFSERADPYENPKYWQYLLKHLYKKINYIVFQTDGARRFYGEIVNRKCSIIPNPALAREKESYYNPDNCKKYLFAAGRLQQRKGFDILVKAFAKISEKYPEHRLIIYGEGTQRELLDKIISDNNLSGKIAILPPQNNVIENNMQAEAFVLPSRSEGIPNILIEAIFAGIPAVATDCSPGGAKLISDNGKYCLLSEVNEQSLAEKLDYALSHRNEMLSLAKEARLSLVRFDPNRIFAAWENVVRLIIKR